MTNYFNILYSKAICKYYVLSIRYHLICLDLDPSGLNDDQVLDRVRNLKKIISDYSKHFPEVPNKNVLAFIENSHIEWRSFLLDLPILNKKRFKFLRIFK